MDEYIYIIGGIAYVAYSIYSATKKKAAADEAKRRKQAAYEEPVVEEKSDPFDIEKIFGLDELKQEIENIPYEFTPYNEAMESQEKHKPIVDEIKPIEKVYDEKVVRQTESILQEETEEERERLDLRKAVIYSEILNPPYIQR